MEDSTNTTDTNLNLWNQSLQSVEPETAEDKNCNHSCCDQNWTVANLQPIQTQRHKMAVDRFLLWRELLDSYVVVTAHRWHRIPGADHQTWMSTSGLYKRSEMTERKAATQGSLVQAPVSTQQHKLSSVLNKRLSLFLSVHLPLPPFCLYYSPLCSSSSLSLSFCVSVSLISTLLFGAPPVVIAWALTIPVSITIWFYCWFRSIAHWIFSPAFLSLSLSLSSVKWWNQFFSLNWYENSLKSLI